MAGKQKPNNGLDDTPQLQPIGKPLGKGRGFKKYTQSNAVKAGAAGVVVLLLVVIIGWQLLSDNGTAPRANTASADAGNSTSTNPPPPMPAVPDTAAPASEQPTPDPNAQNGQTNPEGNTSNGAPTEQPQTEQPQPNDGRGSDGRDNSRGADGSTHPPLPEDISKWTKADFVTARQDNNPKLLEAIAYLSEKSPGSVPVAQQLSELLKAPKPSEGDAAYARGSSFAMTGLIETTVYALGKNGSQAARQTLMQILSGKLNTEDDRTAVEAILKTLVLLPSPENDDILFKLLVSPEDVRPPTNNPQTVWIPEELRTRGLELIKQNASDNLRKKLASHLVQKGMEPNDPIAEFLMQDNPDNLTAQLELYQSPDLTPDAKTRLEQYYLSYCSQALSLMMGIPLGADGSTLGSSRGGVSGRDMRDSRDSRMPTTGIPNIPTDPTREKISDYERGIQLAKVLWGEPLASLMTEHLGDVRSMEKSAPEIVLASTLPLDPIHSAMFKMLKKRAPSESPTSLETAGWADKVVADPSLLVMLKMLPRSKSAKKAPITDSRSGRYPPRRPSGMDPGGSMAEAAQRKEQIETEWMMTLSKMVDSWCTRLEAASQAQKKAIRRGLKVIEPAPTKLDEFELPADAEIIAAYQLNWPDKISDILGKIKPCTLKIQYFRLQQEGMLKKTMNNYKRLAKGGDLHEMPDGLWLDVIKKDPKTNAYRSLDILVTSADMQPVDLTILKEEVLDLEVDILIIEIADPTKD